MHLSKLQNLLPVDPDHVKTAQQATKVIHRYIRPQLAEYEFTKPEILILIAALKLRTTQYDAYYQRLIDTSFINDEGYMLTSKSVYLQITHQFRMNLIGNNIHTLKAAIRNIQERIDDYYLSLETDNTLSRYGWQHVKKSILTRYS